MRDTIRLGALLLLAAAGPVWPATLHVCPDGSGQFPTIQAAADAAESGDLIELCGGTFEGPGNFDLDFGLKSLTLMSPYGNESTVIALAYLPPGAEEPEAHTGVTLGSGTATRIEGITIRGANHYRNGELHDGGAIICPSGSLVLEGVRIEGRWPHGAVRGAGVFMESGSLVATDCVFFANKARQRGGAIYAGEAHVQLVGCYFRGNSGCGSGVVVLRSGTISDSVFEFNGSSYCRSNPGGNAIAASGTVMIERTRFTDNIDVIGGCARVGSSADVSFEDCLIEGGEGMMSAVR